MTSKELAQILGVSPATISMVINNRPGISEVRRQEILARMQELNYRPNTKRSVVKQHSIGFVVFKKNGDILSDSPFFMLLLDTLTRQLAEKHYSLQMIYLSCDQLIRPQLKEIENNACEGLMIFATEALVEDVEVFKSLTKPFVILDNCFNGEDFDTVCIHNENGTRKAINYLLSLNHTAIGYLRSRQIINSFSERFFVYRTVMHENGFEINPHHVLALNYNQENAVKDMEDYLNKPSFQLPTAYLADNDLIAISAIKLFQAHGIRVPEDISIIGFDNRPICELSNPKLTTIGVSVDQIAHSAIYLLTNRMAKTDAPAVKISVGVKLVCRESVAVPRVDT